SSQFSDLKSNISALESEQTAVAAGLRIAREAASLSGTLDTLRNREKELTDEGARLNQEKAAIENRASGLEDAEKQLAACEATLATLEDPRSRIRVLEKEIAREPVLREEMTKIESNIERL